MRTPICANMAFMLCVVKGTEASSPLPCKPTTKPKPINWLGRCAATVTKSLTRSAHTGMAKLQAKLSKQVLKNEVFMAI